MNKKQKQYLMTPITSTLKAAPKVIKFILLLISATITLAAAVWGVITNMSFLLYFIDKSGVTSIFYEYLIINIFCAIFTWVVLGYIFWDTYMRHWYAKYKSLGNKG